MRLFFSIDHINTDRDISWYPGADEVFHISIVRRIYEWISYTSTGGVILLSERPPARISRVMGMLRTRHLQYPDRSLAHLLTEIVGDRDIFMTEDDALTAKITAFKGEYNDPGVDEVVKHCAFSPKLMNAIQDIWLQHPQLRLGQLVMNATPPNLETYKMSDEMLLEQLQLLYTEGESNGT